ncbi:MAG: endolytic transglycosylase MltG [Bacillota bacterium]|nr:endolytic transglycosylase MltG [Bacillota bacterium]
MKKQEIMLNIRQSDPLPDKEPEGPKPDKRKNDNKKGNRKVKPWMIIIGCVLLLMVACFYLTFRSIISDKSDTETAAILNNIDEKNSYQIDIPSGSSTADIAKMLNEQNIIKYPSIFKLISKLDGYDSMYRSGVHYIPKDDGRNNLFKIISKYKEVMIILSSEPKSLTVTFPEGLTVKEVAEKLYQKKVVDIDKFLNTAQTGKFDYKFLKDLPNREDRLEGYLFPDTYKFELNQKESDVIKIMLNNFNEKFQPEFYDQAKKLNMSVDQIIILASIIEKESANPDDRRKIAGVFYNRLHSKDVTLRKLQSCATIKYAFFRRDGTLKKSISIQDTKINDPYNTYQIQGLPPGPICAPSLDSIKAALYPDTTDYMYFLARGDGTTQFSRTYAEHGAAMKKYGLN